MRAKELCSFPENIYFPGKVTTGIKGSVFAVKVGAVLVSRGQCVNQDTTYHLSHKWQVNFITTSGALCHQAMSSYWGHRFRSSRSQLTTKKVRLR
jgi:hypothetical protein